METIRRVVIVVPLATVLPLAAWGEPFNDRGQQVFETYPTSRSAEHGDARALPGKGFNDRGPDFTPRLDLDSSESRKPAPTTPRRRGFNNR